MWRNDSTTRGCCPGSCLQWCYTDAPFFLKVLVIQHERLFWEKQTFMRVSTLPNRAVHLEARRQEDRVWAETLCCSTGHGRMHTVSACLVRGSGHHSTSIRRSAYNDRPTTIFRVIALLDACVEGIQIEMQDRSCCFVHVAHGLSVVSITHSFHCTSIEESFSPKIHAFYIFGEISALQRTFPTKVPFVVMPSPFVFFIRVKDILHWSK